MSCTKLIFLFLNNPSSKKERKNQEVGVYKLSEIKLKWCYLKK